MASSIMVRKSCSDQEKLAQLLRDVALMMHTHLLSPIKYANDISKNPRFDKLAGKIDFPLLKLLARIEKKNPDDGLSDRLWRGKFNSPYDLLRVVYGSEKSFPPKMTPVSSYDPSKFRFADSNPFSLDLVEAVKRQISFTRKITAMYPYDPVPDSLLLNSQQRYAKFMSLIRISACPCPVPAMDIDLFWHTHQLSASLYLPWCSQHVGRPINHDDTIGESTLSTGLKETITAWGDNYFEDYLSPPPADSTVQQQFAIVQQDPPPPHPPAPKVQPPPNPYKDGPPPPGTFPGPTTRDTQPPPGLTTAQLRLWEFDVYCQAQFETRARGILTKKVEIADIDRQLAHMQAQAYQPAPPTPAPQRKSFFRQLLHDAVSGAESEHRPTAAEHHRSLLVATKIRYSEEIRTSSYPHELVQVWGRQRWPLLCAARGWGDATVTHGQFKRPPAGSTELPFPVYAATWYENRDLDYYNYLNARGVEGGGMRVGGGMRGARFDGGNCASMNWEVGSPDAKPFVSSAACGSCGGSG
jgi:hypothetical protein